MLEQLSKIEKSSLNNTHAADPVALDVFFGGVYKSLLLRDRVQVLVAFARFYRDTASHCRALFGGDAQQDIMVVHQGTGWGFLLQPGAVLLKGTQMGGGPELALATLYAHFLTLVSRSECLRFYREFRRCHGRLKDERLQLRSIERMAIKTATQEWRRKNRQVMTGGGHFVSERKSGFLIHRQATLESDQVLDFLLPDPDKAFEKGEVLSGRGSGCTSVRLTIGNKMYFLKRYDCRGWGYRLKNVFRKSRALKVWKATWGFVVRDLPVPQPLLFLEERRFRLLGRAYILSEYREGAERLMTLWPRLTNSERDRVLINSAILLGRTHRFNCIHGDTNWDNLLVVDRSRLDLLMVDLDCALVPWRLSQVRALRDVQHFVRDLCREKNVGSGKKEFFLACWRKWSR